MMKKKRPTAAPALEDNLRPDAEPDVVGCLLKGLLLGMALLFAYGCMRNSAETRDHEGRRAAVMAKLRREQDRALFATGKLRGAEMMADVYREREKMAEAYMAKYCGPAKKAKR